MPTIPVYIACFGGAELLDVAGPTSVFSTATSLLRRRSGYDVRRSQSAPDLSSLPVA